MSLPRRLGITSGTLAMLLLLSGGSASAQYKRTDLVTDTGSGGTLPDPSLKNGWGLTALAASPFWVSDNTTGLSTLYTAAGGKIPLTVTIPGVNGGQGTPTGIVGNATPDFILHAGAANPGKPALFIFSTLDGAIVGWNGGKLATIVATTTDGASYTGLAIASANGKNYLYAADGGPNRKIDVYGADLTLSSDFGSDAFVDNKIPKNFTPYGIQTITSPDGTETIWVTYTALNKAEGGFVDSFTTSGVLKSHFAVSGPLHSPWGVALAPSDFGPMSNALLITNNISRGRINAFNPQTGAFLGPLRDASGNPIEIDGVWAIQFGKDGGPNGAHNQLFFTAGPADYASGIFGMITVD